MSSFIVGEIGIITSASKLGPDRQGKFEFVGSQKGFKVTHYIFRSLPGEYLISYTNRDFLSGDVTFTKHGERIKSSKRLRGIPKTKVSSMPPFLKVRVLPI